MAEYWLVSAPGDPSPHETWEKIKEQTGSLAINHKFNIPELKVGQGMECSVGVCVYGCRGGTCINQSSQLDFH